jgi:hypothetical protein
MVQPQLHALDRKEESAIFVVPFADRASGTAFFEQRRDVENNS